MIEEIQLDLLQFLAVDLGHFSFVSSCEVTHRVKMGTQQRTTSMNALNDSTECLPACGRELARTCIVHCHCYRCILQVIIRVNYVSDEP